MVSLKNSRCLCTLYIVHFWNSFTLYSFLYFFCIIFYLNIFIFQVHNIWRLISLVNYYIYKHASVQSSIHVIVCKKCYFFAWIFRALNGFLRTDTSKIFANSLDMFEKIFFARVTLVNYSINHCRPHQYDSVSFYTHLLFCFNFKCVHMLIKKKLICKFVSLYIN